MRVTSPDPLKGPTVDFIAQGALTEVEVTHGRIPNEVARTSDGPFGGNAFRSYSNSTEMAIRNSELRSPRLKY